MSRLAGEAGGRFHTSALMAVAGGVACGKDEPLIAIELAEERMRHEMAPQVLAAGCGGKFDRAPTGGVELFQKVVERPARCGPQGLRRTEWLRHAAEVLKKLLVGERGLFRRVERFVQSSHESSQNSLLDQRHVLQI